MFTYVKLHNKEAISYSPPPRGLYKAAMAFQWEVNGTHRPLHLPHLPRQDLRELHGSTGMQYNGTGTSQTQQAVLPQFSDFVQGPRRASCASALGWAITGCLFIPLPHSVG